jgi:hypothetical protein
MSEGMRTCGLLLLAITLSVTGETLLEQGMNGIEALDLSPATLLTALWRVFTPPIIALTFAGSLFWLAPPSQWNRNLAYPLLRIGEFASLFVGALALHDQAPPVRVAGARVMVAGVYPAPKTAGKAVDARVFRLHLKQRHTHAVYRGYQRSRPATV